MRQSNIELCRILSVILIIALHSAQYALNGFEGAASIVLWLSSLQAFSIIGVNVFVFITGWFSTKPKKSSMTNLIYTCLFFGVIRCGVNYYLGAFSFKDVFCISKGNWFIICYIGMLLLSPLLNNFVQHSKRKELLIAIVCMFIFQWWFDWLPGVANPNYLDIHAGYSIFSFVNIYLLARYFKTHGIPDKLEKHALSLYLLSSIFIGLILYVTRVLHINLYFDPLAYNNPIVIFSSVCFFCIFKGLTIDNSKVINYVASSTLAVVLIHPLSPFKEWMKSGFCYIRDCYNDLSLVVFWILGILLIYVISILLDQIRIFTYKPIKKYLNK